MSEPIELPARTRAVERLRGIATVWDELVTIPVIGRRVGLDAVLGLIPGVGDIAGGSLGIYGLLVAWRAGAPAPLLLRMLMNIGIDTIVGTVPLLGDLFDVGWKSNTRNVALLERWLERPSSTRRASIVVLWGVVLAAVAGILAILWLVGKGLAQLCG